jgi:RNA polymerase primary sigma factor
VRPLRTAPLLSATEEVALARRIEAGDREAKERMIASNLRLVHAVARMQRRGSVPYADLIQEGTVGLVRAVERFDHRRGLRFSTYGVWWIRRSILDAIAASDLIRLPDKANRQRAAVRRAEEELERIRARHPTDAEIAERIQLSVATVRAMRGAARVTASLDEPVGETATPFGELMADERAIDPSENVIARERRREVSAMLRLLPERHREVLVRRYGLDDGRAQDHEEIGAWLGVSHERSRQIECEALHRLRSMPVTLPRAA